MRLRPYIPDKDYPFLEKWINDEKTHALWCANLLPYPVSKQVFHNFLETNAAKYSDIAFVATENNGQAAGFFCYSINTETNTGFLKFILIDSSKRGKGYGKEMLHLALLYAFQITGAVAVQLNVFSENSSAKRCYEKAGFRETNTDRNIFAYKDELWSRCSVAISKESWMSIPCSNGCLFS